MVKHPVLSRSVRTLILILLLPYLLPASILTLPITLVCSQLFKLFKDQAFRNSVQYLINLVMWPVLMIIYSVIAYVVLPWQWALPITLAALPAPIIAHEVYRLVRLIKSDLKLMCFKELKETYAKIREIIFTK